MSHFSYQELLEATQGKAGSPPSAFEQARLWTDTRSIQPGDFFLPLSGERFDGHDYLDQAFQAGAIGAFVAVDKLATHPDWQRLPNLIAVASPVMAYLAMARLHRNKINPKVIAVTGSSGKTTTKEMLYAALSPLKKTQKTDKNFNNEVGVSQTLLALQPDTEILIVEMGMRGLRQIYMLSEAACPDVAIINNIGPAHIGLLGSLENITKAKLEISEGLNPDVGTLVLNQDAPHLADLAPTVWSGKTVAYTLGEAQNITPILDAGQPGIRFEYGGVSVTLPVPGEHMVANALGVLKVGEALGFTAAQLALGLSAFKPEKGRGERKALKGYKDVWVIDDAYNANPDSAKASIKAFLSTAQADCQHFLVVGGMKELGELSRQYHEQLGLWLAGQPHIDALFTLGEEGAWLAEAAGNARFPVRYAQSLTHLVSQLTSGSLALQNAIVYLKGSRAYKLDELPALLEQAALSPASVTQEVRP